MNIGHTAAIKRVVWSRYDRVLYSTGLDGLVYGWDLVKDGMLNDSDYLHHAGHPWYGLVVELADDKRSDR